MTGGGHESGHRPGSGVLSRYIDEPTRDLNRFSASFEDIQNTRMRAEQRGDMLLALDMADAEKDAAKRLAKALKGHCLYDWLKPLKGLAGARTGRVIAAIGDPRRFPGQKCTEGHVLAPLFVPGTLCPVPAVTAESGTESGPSIGGDGDDPTTGAEPERDWRAGGGPGHDAEGCDENEAVRGSCPGTLLPPRTTTGVRSVWHYFGLYPDGDRLVARRKGVQASYSPRGRALLLGSQGIADQIVRHRTDRYRDLYDDTKARLTVERVDWRPIRVERTARIVATKAFLGDLLIEWKRRADSRPGCVEIDGASLPSPEEVAA